MDWARYLDRYRLIVASIEGENSWFRSFWSAALPGMLRALALKMPEMEGFDLQ